MDEPRPILNQKLRKKLTLMLADPILTRWNAVLEARLSRRVSAPVSTLLGGDLAGIDGNLPVFV
jgi:hypothetical protein